MKTIMEEAMIPELSLSLMIFVAILTFALFIIYFRGQKGHKVEEK